MKRENKQKKLYTTIYLFHFRKEINMQNITNNEPVHTLNNII